ncbi:MAG TPA: hypothetical protein VFM98_03785 [Ramlibacter sp.]|uniref:hypothetical protein n=1 Tax=Ramlibacter sp. TaxID=1917967 RepID=UPI002D7F3B4B|nr:hypothetical protein [Ramlibacter sp.]HET8744702.1 hypothetical protein [Ramlibacter sp.]
MKQAVEPEVEVGLGIFERSCVYCGARFRVLADRPADPMRLWPREYECPACGKQYEIDAASHPEVQLLHGRTDGKDDRYQETMF